MFKKTIKYTDYDGNLRTEDFYFNLNQAEVIRWLTTSGDYTLDKVLMRLSTERNGKEIMGIFEDLIRRSYGKKSIDGRRFIKNDEVWNEFYETEAYSELFTELVMDAKKAAAFVNAVIPPTLAKDIEKVMKENPDGIPDAVKDYVPSTIGIPQGPVATVPNPALSTMESSFNY